MNKLVSVIVPVYNTENYIERCIESILGQNYTDIELILINDGSKQNEEEIIKKYAEKDGRVRYVKNERNIGLYRTRLVGIKQAIGEYVVFLDSDDYISVDYIRLLVKKAEESSADIVFATTVLERTDGKHIINTWHDIESNKLPLEGKKLRNAFMEQAGRAYVWHTICSKLYKRALWCKCMSYMEKLDEHIVMTEDVAFSSILYYYATKADKAENSIYYYCQHIESSTSVVDMTYASIEKKLQDIVAVFSHVENFYKDKSDYERKQMNSFKQYYVCMWQQVIKGLGTEEDKLRAKSQLAKLGCKDEIDSVKFHSYFGEARADFDDTLEGIKKTIIESDAKYISFDIFDTAVVRPFYKPSDMFYLLDKVYEEVEDSVASFHDIRIDAEIACRQSCIQAEREDITLDEIYKYIGQVYGISEELCFKLKQEEQKLELRYCQRRQTVYELYELAIWSGKKVIFVSDMYLGKELLADILKENGYDDYVDIYVSSHYGRLKTTGGLYNVVMDALNIDASDVIHIGDSIRADIEAAERLDIHTIHIPSAMEVFEEKIAPKADNGSGYGSLIAMVANKYFDNPFRYFHPMTTYNMDPYLMGYYALGMNLISQLYWIEKSKIGNGKVIFTSRDGYMMHRACDIYNKYAKSKINGMYMQMSRKAMLPVLLRSRADFMKLPMQYDKATPDGILELLSFCSGAVDKEELSCKYNIQWDNIFADRAEYHKFMNVYMECIYNRQAHIESANLVKEYWNDITSEDAVYDVGYTGSMHYGLVKATGKQPQAMYMHTDRNKYQVMSRKGQFQINSFMDDIPHVSSILREYIFSSTGGSCVGYERKDDMIIPVVEDVERDYCDVWALHTMQEAALDMVHDCYARFTDYIEFLAIRQRELQQPLEALLRVSTKLDTKVFTASYFDDKVAGTDKRLGVRDYWLQVLLTMPGGDNGVLGDIGEFLQERGKSKLAFWGTGQICEDILKANNVQVDVFFDNNPSKNGKRWHGGTIYHPSDVDDINQYYVVIVCGAYMQVEEQLQAIGLEKYKDYVSYIDMF